MTSYIVDDLRVSCASAYILLGVRPAISELNIKRPLVVHWGCASSIANGSSKKRPQSKVATYVFVVGHAFDIVLFGTRLL